jgi:hypothetical protein
MASEQEKDGHVVAGSLQGVGETGVRGTDAGVARWPLDFPRCEADTRKACTAGTSTSGNGGNVAVIDILSLAGSGKFNTSHNMLEVQRMCNRIIFLNRGKVIASGTPIEVTRKILKEDRDAPALDEVFIRIAGRQPDEAVSY